MVQPLLKLTNICRQFNTGEQVITVLNKINLTINKGEMIAIVGASGSGKSTLMNILGCLDKASSGDYYIEGRSTNELTSDELATLRREHFGFIFQRYHLLNGLTALDNVEVPAIYAGMTRAARESRAKMLLSTLRLAERVHYHPNQLSGGQQQRVSIARALMNGGQIILADEPTGALDSRSGKDVLAILQDLHKQGHTIIIVTHDMQIAQYAERIIEIRDGEIIHDKVNFSTNHEQSPESKIDLCPPVQIKTKNNFAAMRDRFIDAFKMALLSITSQRLRAFLTMLGIIIGIASVVSVVALGQGSRQKILSDISAMGTSTLDIYPGSRFGDRKAASIKTLRPTDADALSQQKFIHSVTPFIGSSGMLRVGNISLLGSINGVGNQYFNVKGYSIAHGMAFSERDVRNLAQEAVIDTKTSNQLFPNQNPLGQVILVGNLPVRVIGVVADKKQGFMRSENLNVWLPYTTVLNKMLGRSYLQSIILRIDDEVTMPVAEQAIENIMLQRHGQKDFFIFNTDTIRQTIESTTATMALLVSMIALISLIVGGIGVMNIMLVSVTERTREIGVRMAVGARSSDIRQQFLIEAVLICLVGGIIGIILSFLIGFIFSQFSDTFTLIYSNTSIIVAFICSTLIGVIFGFIPARRAANMDPIHALERE